MKPTVFVVDDDRSMREALHQLLDNAGFEVKSFSDGQSFLSACSENATGCVLLDMAMPGMSGCEVQLQLKQREISLPVIFLTGHGDIPKAVQALQAGAMDFLEKPVTGKVLLDRVRRAIKLDEKKRLDENAMFRVQQNHAKLSPREQEIMSLIVSGRTNKEIARELSISVRTVETHRNHVMYKMGADNLVELVKLAAVCCD